MNYRIKLLVVFFFTGLLFAGCGNKYKSVKVGFLVHAFDNERWEKDRDYFVDKVKELGGTVEVLDAGNDAAKQLEQAKQLIDHGVDVLVVVPVDQYAAADIVAAAHKENIKVIAYDRLIKNCDLDYYVSTDNVAVGALQATYLTTIKPKGKYAIIGGAITDNNSQSLCLGQRNVLQPLIDKGDIVIVYDEFAKAWKESEGYRHAQKILEKNPDVDAIIAGNDDLANGAIKALAEIGKDGKVLVAGMDANATNIEEIKEGKQTCTISKPYQKLASMAADMAVGMARGQEHGGNFLTVENGKKLVPTVMFNGIIVNKANIDLTISQKEAQ